MRHFILLLVPRKHRMLLVSFELQALDLGIGALRVLTWFETADALSIQNITRSIQSLSIVPATTDLDNPTAQGAPENYAKYTQKVSWSFPTWSSLSISQVFIARFQKARQKLIYLFTSPRELTWYLSSNLLQWTPRLIPSSPPHTGNTRIAVGRWH